MYRYVLLLLAVRVLGPVPVRILYQAAKLAGWLAFYLNGRGRRSVLANLRQVLPEATPSHRMRIGRLVFMNVARLYVDLIRIPRLDLRDLLERRVEIRGFAALEDALRAGNGVVVASIHYGSYELAPPLLHALGMRGYALSEPLRPKAYSDLVHRLRNRPGETFHPVSRSSIRAALRTLKRGEMVIVAVDRDIQGSGICVEFFGRPTRMPTGAIDLALRTGAAVLPVIARRLPDDRHLVQIGPQLELIRTGHLQCDVRRNLEALLRVFEECIRADPSQWLVLEPVWRPCGPGSANAPARRAKPRTRPGRSPDGSRYDRMP